MSDLMLDVGLANELKMSFRRNGWTEREVKKASEGDFLAQVRGVLLGHAEIITPEHFIDCDAYPFVPNGWIVVGHQKGGAFKWDTVNVSLHLDEGQKNGKRIEGYKLRRLLAGKPVLNANVLDYLLAHPHLIPEEWKGKYVFFWGTIYRRQLDDRQCIRCLRWLDDKWDWISNWLGYNWYDGFYAAVHVPVVQQS